MGKEVKRQITPDSPLVFSGFLDDNESVFSSHGSACDESPTSSPSSYRRTIKRDKAPRGKLSSRTEMGIEPTGASMENRKIGSKERLAIASERILRLEAQFNQQTSEVHKGMRAF